MSQLLDALSVLFGAFGLGLAFGFGVAVSLRISLPPFHVEVKPLRVKIVPYEEKGDGTP